MKARLVLAAGVVGVIGVAGVASAEEPVDRCPGALIQLHLDLNGEQQSICLPPEGGSPLPGLPGLPLR